MHARYSGCGNCGATYSRTTAPAWLSSKEPDSAGSGLKRSGSVPPKGTRTKYCSKSYFRQFEIQICRNAPLPITYRAGKFRQIFIVSREETRSPPPDIRFFQAILATVRTAVVPGTTPAEATLHPVNRPPAKSWQTVVSWSEFPVCEAAPRSGRCCRYRCKAACRHRCTCPGRRRATVPPLRAKR